MSNAPPTESVSDGDVASPNGDGQADFSPFGVRLRQAAAEVGKSSAKLAELLGLTRGTFARYWNGERLPPSNTLLELADLVQRDARWLVRGHPVPEQGQRAAMDDKSVEVEEVDLSYGLGGSFVDENAERQTHRFPVAWLRGITRTPPAMLFFARGRGDSMMPTITDGDMILIDRSQVSVREQDALWALAIGEIAMIKRVRVRGDKVELLSDNERVPPYDAIQEEINVVGRVIFIGRRV